MMSDYSRLHLYFLNKLVVSLAEAVTSACVFVRGTMRALSREQNRDLSLYCDKIHTHTHRTGPKMDVKAINQRQMDYVFCCVLLEI